MSGKNIRVALALGMAAAGALMLPGSSRASDPPPTEGRMVVNSFGVQTIVGGEFTTEPATDAPAGLQLANLTMDTYYDTYFVTAHFDAPYEVVSPDQVLFMSLQPPAGPRMRLLLRDDLTSVMQVAEGDQFVDLPDDMLPMISIAGDEVTFELALAGLLPDDGSTQMLLPGDGSAQGWEMQVHLIAPVGDGGYHAHTPQVPVFALSGEGTSTPVSRYGNLLGADGRPQYFTPPTLLPGGMQIAEMSAGADDIVELQFASPPTDLSGTTVDAPTPFTVAFQQFGIAAYRTPGDANPFLLTWTPAASSPGVSLEGDTAQFAFKLHDEITLYDDTPAAVGHATATPQTCDGPPVTFDVTAQLASGTLTLSHSDGDVAAGAVDPATGQGTLASPGGREYSITMMPDAITGTHVYAGCTYGIEIDLDSPFNQIDATLGDNPLLQPFVRLEDAAGGGLYLAGPLVPFGQLVAQGQAPVAQPTPGPDSTGSAPADTTGDGATPATDIQQPELPAAEAFPRQDSDDNNALIFVGIGIGVIVLVGIGFVIIVRTKREQGEEQPPATKHPPTREDPATGMQWVTDETGRPIRPVSWVQRADGTWGPPAGQEQAMSDRTAAIAAGRDEQNAAKSIAEHIERIDDPVAWWFAKTGYDLWDTFSGGTLDTVEQQDNLGTLQGILDSIGTGASAVGNMVTLGVSHRIRDNMTKHAPEINRYLDVLRDDNASFDLKADALLGFINHIINGVEEGGKDAIVDLLPYDEIKTLRNPNASTEAKTKAVFTGIAKIATLIAIVLGIKAGLKGKGGQGGKRGGGGSSEQPTSKATSKGGTNPELSKGGVRPALQPEGAPPAGDGTIKYEPGEAQKLVTDSAAVDKLLNDPLDPAIDPVTGEPLPEPVEPPIEDGAVLEDGLYDYQKFQPTLDPMLEAQAIEVRALDYEKVSSKAGGMTEAERILYERQRAADIARLKAAGPEFWDAITDPQTKATLEALRDSW